MAKPEIVPATHELLTRFYGKPPTRTQKSLAVMEGDEVVSIVGVYRDNGRAVLFSDSRPEVVNNMKRYAKVAVKCVKILTPYMKEIGEVVSVADKNISRSDAFLAHFGFINIRGDVWAQRQ